MTRFLCDGAFLPDAGLACGTQPLEQYFVVGYGIARDLSGRGIELIADREFGIDHAFAQRALDMGMAIAAKIESGPVRGLYDSDRSFFCQQVEIAVDRRTADMLVDGVDILVDRVGGGVVAAALYSCQHEGALARIATLYWLIIACGHDGSTQT